MNRDLIVNISRHAYLERSVLPVPKCRVSGTCLKLLRCVLPTYNPIAALRKIYCVLNTGGRMVVSFVVSRLGRGCLIIVIRMSRGCLFVSYVILVTLRGRTSISQISVLGRRSPHSRIIPICRNSRKSIDKFRK